MQCCVTKQFIIYRWLEFIWYLHEIKLNELIVLDFWTKCTQFIDWLFHLCDRIYWIFFTVLCVLYLLEIRAFESKIQRIKLKLPFWKQTKKCVVYAHDSQQRSYYERLPKICLHSTFVQQIQNYSFLNYILMF